MSDDPVTEACAELRRWLQVAGTAEVRRDSADAGLPAVSLGLITEHDEMNQARRRTQARSMPPWNPVTAAAIYDAHAAIRQVEADLQVDVTGRPRAVPRTAAERDTLKALDNIPHLAAGADRNLRDYVIRKINHVTTQIRQLPAIDDLPVWQRLRPGPDGLPPRCPYCLNFSLAVAVASGMVTCRYPPCLDTNGDRPLARMELGQRSAQPMLRWADGLIEVAP